VCRRRWPAIHWSKSWSRRRNYKFTDKEHHLFEQLSARCGIVPGYHDIWGNYHELTPQTCRKVLRAMTVIGVDDDGDDVDPAQALAALERRDWQRWLAPVQVVAEDAAPIAITLTLPVQAGIGDFRWKLSEEDGRVQEQWLSLTELDEVRRHTVDGRDFVRYRLILPHMPATGYHRFELIGREPAASAVMSLIVTPRRCFLLPRSAENERVWGVTLQLYALRSQRNWGIGDFSDLRSALDGFADLGAQVIGLNPLHALFPCDPGQISPYSPSSRLFLNPLYIDVEATADYAECEAVRAEVREPRFQARLQALRADDLIDYETVSELKLALLQRLYRHFREQHLDPDSERGEQFRRFCEDGGTALRRHALFEVLQRRFRAQDIQFTNWHHWPESYRSADEPTLARCAAEQQDELEFFLYLQWQAALQLRAVADHAAQRRLAVGLYRDLAVGVAGSSADTWADQALYADAMHIGAPPDDFSPQGQDWGLPPLLPQQLHERAYQPFIAMLRANMQGAGALRIDHVMGLMRLFWIPAPGSGAEGAYVGYPLDDLLGIVALESQRHRCVVIGEDLGTVPDEMRRALYDAGVLSYRLLYFEKHWHGDHSFKAPAEYPQQALVAAATHDLPTLRGFWQEHDLQLRDRYGLFPSDDMRGRQYAGRAEDRLRLLWALQREQLLPGDFDVHGAAAAPLSEQLIHALHVFLARTPSAIMVVQLEDLLGQLEQVNLPATIDQYPNWRRKLPCTLESIAGTETVRTLFDALRRERGPAG
jgi:(1->4)-alpha-D-glucan 1-alpha-D-glucosylmutase